MSFAKRWNRIIKNCSKIQKFVQKGQKMMVKPVRLKNRTKKKCFALSEEENRILIQTAGMMDMNQTELIVYAVKKVRQLELQRAQLRKHERERASRADQAGRVSS